MPAPVPGRQWEENVAGAAPRGRAGSATQGTKEVDGFPVACGAGLPADRLLPLAAAPGAARTSGRYRGSAQREMAGTGRRDRLVTGGPPTGGSGHEGRRCSCRVPPSVGSTGAVVRKAGPLRRATHASPGTRGHTATSPGPSLQSPPAWPRFRSPSLSLEDLGIGVSSAACTADPRFNDILPGGPAGGEWADCTAMVTEVCAPHKSPASASRSWTMPRIPAWSFFPAGGQAVASASSSTGR
jgi:hypothetical protein